MKICINCLLIQPGKTGGGETFLVNLVERLSRLDTRNEYLLLVTEENATLFDTASPRFQKRVVMKSAEAKLKRIAFETFALPILLKQQHIDVYYSPFGTLPTYLPCKSVVTFQNLIYLDFNENTSYRGRSFKEKLSTNFQAMYYRMTSRSTLKRADKVWAVSKATADAVTERYGIDSEKISVVYEGVNFGQFHPGMGQQSTSRPIPERYILMVASLYPNKNIDLAIRAFRRLVDNGHPQKLLIVGNDWQRYRERLEKLVAQLHLTDRVHFVGAIPHSEIPPYFQYADLFLMISNVESFGLPVLEAMAAGVPVIISQRSALPEIAGDAAISADIRNTNHIADQMMRILTDRALTARLRERGWNRARSFDWNATAARAIDLFNSLDPEEPHSESTVVDAADSTIESPQQLTGAIR